MRIPQRPPKVDFAKLWTDPSQVAKLIGIGPTIDGRYRHWDRLRRLKAPNGLSTEEWWAGITLGRASLRKATPLRDAKGNPFMIGLPDAAQEKLHTIDRDVGGQLASTAEPITNSATRDYYLIRSLMEEAITSSQLEGASTTREVAKEMLRSGRPARTTDERMILNNFVAMKRVLELVKSPLSPETVFELHHLTTEGTLASPDATGRFRRADEQIWVEDEIGEVLHVPPPAEQLPERMQSLCAFANGETPSTFLHPVVRAILIHFWLAYDHPFVDGNGRTARVLFYWSLIRSGYWLCEYISISRILKKAPARYARSFLYTETDANDLTYFLLFNLDVTRRAIDELYEFIRRKSEEVAAVQALIDASALLNHRQATLLSDAMKHPGARYTIQQHQNTHGVVYQTARTDLLDLAKLGLLIQRKVSKNLVFSVPPDIATRMNKL